MKIELRRDADNKVIGYRLLKEETDDTYTIEYVRDLLFFGMDDNVIQYDGRTSNANGETIELKWAKRGYVKKKREEERLESEKYWASRSENEPKYDSAGFTEQDR